MSFLFVSGYEIKMSTFCQPKKAEIRVGREVGLLIRIRFNSFIGSLTEIYFIQFITDKQIKNNKNL